VRPPPASDIPDLLGQLASRGQRPALSFYRGKAREGGLSYAELLERIDRLAAALHLDQSVRRGDRVALLTPNRLEVPVIVLALLRLGAVVVPLNPVSAVEDWAYILGHSGARGVWATRELRGQLEGIAGPSFILAVEEAFAGERVVGLPVPEVPSPGSLAEELGVVLYTSGTTGTPKGVALRQRSLLANAWSMAENFGLDGTPQLAVLPLYHAHAFGFGLMTALATGGHLVFTERLEPFTWAAVVRAESVAVASVVPTLLPMLLAAGVTQEKVPTLRHLMVSSAPLSVELARDFETRTGLRLTQGWGLSEYTNFACCMSPGLPAPERDRLMFSEEMPSIGHALSGTEVRVVDGNDAPVGEGERGELRVRGHSTMRGYFGDSANSAAAFDSEGWLKTGDEGFFRLSAGRPAFFVSGRLKEIIIRDAEKYSPLRLERTLQASLPQLAGSLVVLGFPHIDHGEEVGAYLQLDSLEEGLKIQLAAAIQAMPIAERPKVILFGARPIPRTHTGKIQRRHMQPWFAGWAGYRGPLLILAAPATSLSP
jgi:long-chain acyl-CoA synthetase